jgi:predicted TPR repeat methyltransferase
MAPAVLQAAYSASCCTAPYSRYIALIAGMRSPYACREYKVRAVGLASSTQSRVVLDLGCGLGDIIGRVRAEKRWGVDISAAAIAAARRLFGGRVSFAVGSVLSPDEIAKVVSDRPIDLVIMTNRAHGTELEELVTITRSIQQKLSVLCC